MLCPCTRRLRRFEKFLYVLIMSNSLASPIHHLTVHTVPTNEAVPTESRRCNCFVRDGGYSNPKRVFPEAEVSNPTAGSILLWAANQFRGNYKYWRV